MENENGNGNGHDTTPPSAAAPRDALAVGKRNEREIARFARILHKRGFSVFDPDTEEGRFIISKAREYEAACPEHMSAAKRADLIERAVAASVICRALESQIIKLGGVPPAGTSQRALGQQKGYALTIHAWERATRVLVNVLNSIESAAKKEGRRGRSPLDNLRDMVGVEI